MPAELVRSPIYVEDLGQAADETATVTVDILDATGTEVPYTCTPINDNGLTSSATTRSANPAWSTLTTIGQILQWVGAAITAATTTVAGIVKISATGDTALGTADARVGRIPDSDTSAGLTAYAGTSNAPSASNPFWPQSKVLASLLLDCGSGADGHGQLGAIAASSTAPTAADGGAGLLTGATLTWKIAAYNLSGEIVASSASGSLNLTSRKATLTLPALPTAAMGWRVYRSTDGVNYYLVGVSVGSGTSYTDNNPTANTSVTAPSSDTTGDTATLSGEFHFSDFTFPAGKTINFATSGSYAGVLVIRVTGTFTPGGTITGVGAHRVLLNRHKMGFHSSLPRTANVTASAATFGPASVGASSQGPVGFGADWHSGLDLLQGFGAAGSDGGTNVAGGYGGAFLQIIANQIASGVLTGTYVTSGGAGTAGTGGGSFYCEGGGGGAGGTQLFASPNPWKSTATHTSAGGNGGNAAGAGGANTVYGGGAGGGGYVIVLGPYGVDTSGATISTAAGSNGANNTSGSGSPPGYNSGGANAGNGANVSGSASASAGQTINLATAWSPKMWGIA